MAVAIRQIRRHKWEISTHRGQSHLMDIDHAVRVPDIADDQVVEYDAGDCGEKVE